MSSRSGSRILSALIALMALPVLSAQAQRRAAGAAQPSAAAAQSTVNSDWLSALKYRYVGSVGNRTIAVVSPPGDPNTYYVGSASGGIFKTTDGGVHWAAIFDDQPVSSVGALAIAPSDPNVVWAGTGESFIRSHISVGWGVFRSTDAGKTWTKTGLDNTGRIARVIIHPANPDIVYVCALGHAYGPQQERGVFRSMDGGKSWDRVLFADENTGCSDLAMDPRNPRILFAGTWTIEIHTWGRSSGGPNSGLWKSTDGGTTWKRLRGNGLPMKNVGKVGVAIAPTNPNHIYALIETGDGVPLNGEPQENGELWTSLDGGDNWTLTSNDRNLGGRTQYYNRVVVSTDNENEAYFLSAGFTKTIDGGRTSVNLGFGQSPGGDNHDMWIDPGNANRMAVAHDQGVVITTNRGQSWNAIQLPNAQLYHVQTDTRIPYYVYTNRQDGPSFRGPSNPRTGGGGGFGGGGGGGGGIGGGGLGPPIVRGEWTEVGGGESGWATPDPEDPNIVWSTASGRGTVGGIVVRYDVRTKMYRHVEIWPENTSGTPAADVKYRFVWDAPFLISPHDHNKVYMGSQYVHVSTDGGNSWRIISPDLTLNDRSKMGPSGGLTPDNIGVEYAGVVYRIAESRLKPGLIWAGTNDGVIQLTQNGGQNWTNVTANIPNLPPWGTFSSITPSRYDTATAYATVDYHQMNNRDPYVYKTTDYGKTWKMMVNGIPKSPLSYAHVIKEDPVRRGLLYLGTENALYLSFDDGAGWQPLQSTLPHAPVYWIDIQEHFMDLAVATYGRGVWILDDITPLQQLTPEVLAQDAYLLEVHPTYRFRPITPPMGMSADPIVGRGPQYGASISYWLKAAPPGDVGLTIQDASGKMIRRLRGTKQVGINRVYWDLRDDPSTEVRLRVSPLHAPYFDVPAEGRPAPMVGRFTVLQPPGTYTVKLSVGGKEFSRTVEVRKDPNSAGSDDDIKQQVAALAGIKGDINATAEMLNGIEMIRKQLQDLSVVLAANRAAADARAAADSLEQKFIALEGNMHQIKATGRGQEDIRWPHGLIEKFFYLAGGVEDGDFPPTTQAKQVTQEFENRIKAYRAQYDQLVSQDLATLNNTLRQRNIGNIIATMPPLVP